MYEYIILLEGRPLKNMSACMNVYNECLKAVILMFVVGWLPLQAAHASASIKDVHNMVDICANLHRVQKDYALVGMGVRYDNPAEDLKKVIAKIDQEFHEIIDDHHLSKELEAESQALFDEWKKIRVIAESAPTQDNMLKLHKAVEALTDKCLEAVKHLEEDLNLEGERYVVESVEMGMEVQRLAALYLIRAWDIKLENYFEEVKHVLEEFESFFHDLEKAPERFVTKETKAKIVIIEKEFLVFERMAESKSGRFVPSLAQRSAKKLLTKIDLVTQSIIERVEK